MPNPMSTPGWEVFVVSVGNIEDMKSYVPLQVLVLDAFGWPTAGTLLSNRFVLTSALWVAHAVDNTSEVGVFN